MKRTEFTYGQLDKVLRSYGFSCRLVEGDPPARVYEHKETGALVMMPPYPFEDKLLGWHWMAAHATVDQYGIADADNFDEKMWRLRLRRPSNGTANGTPRRRSVPKRPTEKKK